MIQTVFGVGGMILFAWCLSDERGSVSWRVVGTAMAIQFGLALLLFTIPAVRQGLLAMTTVVQVLLDATREGTTFVLGYLGGGDLPFESLQQGNSFILLFQVLPLVLVVSALSSLLFYLRVLPFFIKIIAWMFHKTLNIGGALGLASASSVFLGMDVAPLVVRPHLKDMSHSEIFAMMTVAMATVAGNVMALYAVILSPVLDNVMAHIISASLINVPAALCIAHVMMPNTTGHTASSMRIAERGGSVMDAISRGVQDGVQVLMSVASMLIVLIALVSLFNKALGLLPPLMGEPVTLQGLLGYVMSPLMWLMGIPFQEIHAAGTLMATKTVLNELIAYANLASLPPGTLSPRSQLMMVYAMCGFANFGSIGILIGTVGALVPERRPEVVRYGGRAVLAGTLATAMTGAVVGFLYNLGLISS